MMPENQAASATDNFHVRAGCIPIRVPHTENNVMTMSDPPSQSAANVTRSDN
jgi:hypothetical protein